MINGEYYDLEKILPHKKPMILIDRVIEYDIDKLTLVSEIDVKEDAMFFDINIEGVPSWIGLEYMAQTIAALSGIIEREKSQGEPVMGFILGTRKYDNNIKCYQNGQTYKVVAEEQFNNMELCSFKCEIKDCFDNICASAELNVFRPLDQKKFIEEMQNG